MQRGKLTFALPLQLTKTKVPTRCCAIRFALCYYLYSSEILYILYNMQVFRNDALTEPACML